MKMFTNFIICLSQCLIFIKVVDFVVFHKKTTFKFYQVKETLWGNAYVANLFRILHTKFYQNRPSFVDGMTKTFWLLFIGHGVGLYIDECSKEEYFMIMTDTDGAVILTTCITCVCKYIQCESKSIKTFCNIFT